MKNARTLLRTTLPAATAVLLLFTASGCGKGDAKKGPQDEAVPVRVETLQLRSMTRSLEYAATVSAQDEALVYPRVPGKISEKTKEDGAPVQKGDVIAYIDRDEVGLKFERAPIESPLAGVVGRVYVDKGTSVTPQTPVALVVNMENVKVTLDVPEKHTTSVLLGQEAQISVDAWPGETFTGRVSKISPVVDIQTRSAPVEIIIANPAAKLKPGMFCRVALVMEHRENVLVVAKEAVMGREPDTHVYTTKGSVATLTKVKLGLRQGAEYEVIEGLKAGDSVVVMGQQRLHDGSTIRIEAK